MTPEEHKPGPIEDSEDRAGRHMFLMYCSCWGSVLPDGQLGVSFKAYSREQLMDMHGLHVNTITQEAT